MKGLSNVGNSCYLNAALQCLLYAPPLVAYLISGLAEQDLHRKRANACALATQFISLAKAYWTSRDPPCLDTAGLWAALCKLHKPFAGQHPQDAHEALAVTLRHLHDAWAKTPPLARSVARQHVHHAAWDAHVAATGYSMVTELFQGQLEQTVREPADGGYCSVTHEHFTGLSLDLEGCATVTQALNKFLRAERIEEFSVGGGAAPVAVTQTKRVLYMPLLLVLHLKRFDAAGNKIERFVDYSTTLRCADDGGEYELFAACFHRDGHYVAACESAGRWTLMDDSVCCPLEVDSVVQRDAYMLLYKKVGG